MRRHSRSESVGRVPENDLEKNKDDVPPRKLSKLVRRRNFVKEYLIDYTANSNLHGLKYIGEKERTFVEKIFWLFMFICCVVLCAGLIRKVWIKWNESPVIVSFAENPTPVWQGCQLVCNASGMFAEYQTDGFEAILRKKTASLMRRVRGNFNTILKTIADRLTPPIWK